MKVFLELTRSCGGLEVLDKLRDKRQDDHVQHAVEEKGHGDDEQDQILVVQVEDAHLFGGWAVAGGSKT